MIGTSVLHAAASVQMAAGGFSPKDLVGIMDFSQFSFAKTLIIGLLGAMTAGVVLVGFFTGLISTGKMAISSVSGNEMNTARAHIGFRDSLKAIAFALSIGVIVFLLVTFISGMATLVLK